MKLFLDDFVNTLTTRGQDRVALLVEEAKTGKDDITVLAQRLTSLQPFAELALYQETAFDFIKNGNFLLNFRDVELQTEELFRVTNTISDLLTAHTNILGSQVKALEDDLAAMEKSAQNFAFLLAEGGSFDLSYLEPFNNERGRESFTFDIPDRASLVFGPAERAEVRSDEGTLALSGSTIINHGMSGQLLTGNATGYVKTQTEISNALQPNSEVGWRYVVGAPHPVNSPVHHAHGRAGAQALLEFHLSAAAPASEIKLIPFAEHPIEVLYVALFSSRNSAEPFVVLETPTLLQQPFTVHFPVRTVAKFQILLNQPVYERVVDAVHPGEASYRKLRQEIGDNQKFRPQFENLRNLFPTRAGYADILSHLSVVNFLRHQSGLATLSIPEPIYNPIWGPLKIDRILHDRKSSLGDTATWDRRSAIDDTMVRNFWFLHRDFDDLFVRLSDVARARVNHTVDKADPGGFFRTIQPVGQVGPITRPQPGTAQPDSDNLPNASVTPVLSLPVPPPQPVALFDYTYYIGLEYVGIGVNAPGFKGVFVSKPVPASGDLGELRIKTSETNFSATDILLDNPVQTSVEYSVSNVSTPLKETDWIPIQPINLLHVESERFFPDSTGLGFFRFPADRTAPVRLFKNGMALSLNQAWVYDATNSMIVGAKLPLGQSSTTDLFTCLYTPAQDETLINFPNRGFGDLPLVSAHDATGPGEGFSRTGGRNTIALGFTPYVDPVQVDATYNSTVKVPLYQPITVQLLDGTTAINSTNYGKGSQPPLPASNPPLLTYLHSGDSLIFSDPILSPFRVFYQYIQNNVRIRVVLRANSNNYVTPTVDYFQVKARTRRAQTLKVFQ